MISIALGANLPSPAGDPSLTLPRALQRLGELGVQPLQCSRLYRTSPVPPSGQPDFMNAVAEIKTALGPLQLLHVLHKVEAEFGRTREQRWAARTLDLDLLSYGDLIQVPKAASDLGLPHQRLHERRFVLAPLAEIAPEWRHPQLGLTAAQMLAELPEDDLCEPVAP